jgi:uncharacterized protein (TIGR02646 family)
MIKINKPEASPLIAYTQKARAGECRLQNASRRIRSKFEEDEHKYTTEGLPKTLFRKDIYDHEVIKEVLKRKVQYNKCCYCEQYILDNESLEHFRPKDGYQQERSDDISKPGYYWLAHVWSNLMYSCGKCNSTKGAYFPLDEPKHRALNHLTDGFCKNEFPLIIDPTQENPQEFIEFFWLEPFGKGNNSSRGELTINAVGLRRTGMFEARNEHWDRIVTTKMSMKRKITRKPGEKDELREEYEAYLLECMSEKSQFSAMVNDNLTEFILN